MSNHMGSLRGGHYTAYCKEQGSWYCFDDARVSKVHPSKVASAEAYVLCALPRCLSLPRPGLVPQHSIAAQALCLPVVPPTSQLYRWCGATMADMLICLAYALMARLCACTFDCPFAQLLRA